MRHVPITTHLFNFSVKFLLFLLIFFSFQFFNLIHLRLFALIGLPFFFTLIGIVADWVVVPKHHNIPSAAMGSLFMGFATYFLTKWFALGTVRPLSAFLLAIFLGVVEVTLHRLIVKPYLNKA